MTIDERVEAVYDSLIVDTEADWKPLIREAFLEIMEREKQR